MSDGGTTRRSALARIGLFAFGALGIGYVARDATESSSRAAAPAPSAREKNLTVYGREWRLHSPNRVPGEKPPAGDRPTPQGRLVDERERTIGAFTSAAIAGLGALELHTFNLADGQIFGVGASAAPDGTATYAVIGGTGRYAGAAGSYRARQSFDERGGAGTAEFTLTLDNLEA
jgi:hypothetical protein